MKWGGLTAWHLCRCRLPRGKDAGTVAIFSSKRRAPGPEVWCASAVLHLWGSELIQSAGKCTNHRSTPRPPGPSGSCATSNWGHQGALNMILWGHTWEESRPPTPEVTDGLGQPLFRDQGRMRPWGSRVALVTSTLTPPPAPARPAAGAGNTATDQVPPRCLGKGLAICVYHLI